MSGVFNMEKSYPDRLVPAHLFKLNKRSEGLKSIVIREDGKHNLDSARLSLEYIRDLLGNPGHQGVLIVDQDKRSLNYDLSKWFESYRNLWTPVLSWYRVHCEDDENWEAMYQAYLLTAKMLMKGRWSAGQSEYDLALKLYDKHSDIIASPWIPFFIDWDAVGRKQYVVSQGLCEKLRKTVLKGYPSDSFKLPYDSFYIDLRNYGSFGEHVAEGCLVINLRDEVFSISLITGESNTQIMIPRVLPIDLRYATLEEGLEAAFKLNAAYGEYKVAWRELFSYIVNVVLYATMPDCESEFQYYDPRYEKLQKKLQKHPKGSQKYKKAREKLGRIDKAGYDYLGGSIRVDRSGDRESSGVCQETGRKLTVRTLVSGHWRDQPCGAGRRDIKRIWIEPFWRGPEGVPITHRPHSLK